MTHSRSQQSLDSVPRGLFLVLDGPDGGGKTTQVAALAEWLRARGERVVTCRDPGGTPLGERLRAILLDRNTSDLGLRAEMLLYMAGRAQLVEQVIAPSLAEGCVVVSDRYLLANLVYQGFAGGLNVDELARVGQAATNGLMPDLTLLLDVPEATARRRVGPARDRIEDRSEAYHARVRQGFLRAWEEAQGEGCAYYPGPIVRIDAAADAEAVAARIRSEVERVLAVGSRT